MRRAGRRAAFTALLTLVAATAGCGSDSNDDESAVSTGSGARALEHFKIAGIAADPTGGGWILEDVDGAAMVHHLDQDNELEKTAELPRWNATDVLGVPDGRLAAMGVRCDQAEPPAEECGSSVVEIVWVSADGGVTDPATIATFESNPDDVSVRMGGIFDGRLWVTTRGDLYAIGETGRVEEQVEGVSSPCIVDDGIYVLSESGRPEEATPTDDPEHPITYSVSAVTNGKIAAVEGATLEGPSNSLGECVPSGFELYVSTQTQASRWTPASGWVHVERPLDPTATRSTHALGTHGDEFIVDEAGTLLVRNAAAAWEPTAITFDATRSKDAPPLVLFADRSGEAVIGCMSVESERPSQYGLECQVGGAR